MGTRSLTKVIQKWETESGKEKKRPIISMYRQYDGYPEGHGIELAEFLDEFSVVNGLGLDKEKKIANGMDCLAAQIVAEFKTGPGGIYLQHPDTTDVWEQFVYEIEDTGKGLSISIYDSYEKDVIFKGSPEELINKFYKE